MLVPEVTTRNIQAPDQRRERRIPIRKPAQMRPVYPCVLNRVPIILLEESLSGAAILTSEPLYHGSLVQILYDDLIRLAEVRYCLPHQEGYRIGLRIRACHHTRSM